MKIKPLIILSILTLFLTTNLKSQELYNGFYIATGIGYDNNSVETMPSTMSVQLAIGKSMSSFLDLELGYLSSVNSSKEVYNSDSTLEGYATSNSNTLYAHFKPKVKIVENGKLFALIGASYIGTKLKVEDYFENSVNNRFTFRDRTASVAYDFGFGYEHVLESNISNKLDSVSIVAQYKYSMLGSTKYKNNKYLTKETPISSLQDKNNVSLILKLSF